jgi:ribosomal 50S subunit-recycling heat shock protein
MRLDLFLKLSRLVPRRTLAQQMCEAGAVKLNGSTAKSAHLVRPGDEIEIRQRGRLSTIRVLDVPGKQVSKSMALSLYEITGVESYEAEVTSSGAGPE